MDMGPMNSVDSLRQSGVQRPQESDATGSFTALLQEAIAQVETAQRQADAAARDFAISEAQSVHDVVLRLEQADLSLRLLTQVRNKVVDAYQEVMRMSI
jgi:flagellar hook-basal body complex protein FliE